MAQLWPGRRGTPPRHEPEAALEAEDVAGRLLRDAVAALPGGVLRGFDLLPALAAQDADEAPDGVRPASPWLP